MVKTLLLLLALGCENVPVGLDEGPPSNAPPSGVAVEECAGDGWCWVRGRPTTVTVDRDLVYAVGVGGAFLRWEDAGWIAYQVPTERTLVSAWVEGDAWVSDEIGSAWHFDGSEWSEHPAPVPILNLIAGPDGSVWAKSSGGSNGHGGASIGGLLSWSGEAWVEPIARHAYCLEYSDFVVFEGEVWSAGLWCDETGLVRGVEVRRWDGSSWALVGDPIPDQGWYPTLEIAEGRVHFRASGRFEWDGTTWRSDPHPSYPQQVPLDQFAVFDGIGFTIVPRSLGCSDVLRLGDGRAWCFGEGQIFVERGVEWAPTLFDPFGQTATPSQWETLPPALWAGSDTERAWGSDPSDVYRIRRSSRKLEHYDGSSWSIAFDGEVIDVAGNSSGERWIATEAGLSRRMENELVLVPNPNAIERPLKLLGLSTGVLMLTHDRLLLHDEAWSVLREAPRGWMLIDVAGSSLSDVWLVSTQISRTPERALEHFDGTNWTTVAVDGLDWFSALTTTSSGETWLLSGGFLQRLGSNDPPLPMTWPMNGTPWIGSDAIWVSTSAQAQRHPL